MYGIIYKTTFVPTGEWYIGQHKCSSDEFDGYLGSGVIISDYTKTHDHKLFKRITLATAETQEDLDDLEIFYIEALNCLNDPNCWNIAIGGRGGSYINSDKIPESLFNYYKTEDGQETKKIIGENSKKLWENENYRKQQSESRSASWTDERKNLQGPKAEKQMKELWASAAGAARKEDPTQFNRKSVRCVETGEIYTSGKEAAEKNKTTAAKISSAVNHGTKVHGLHFELVKGGGC